MTGTALRAVLDSRPVSGYGTCFRGNDECGRRRLAVGVCGGRKRLLMQVTVLGGSGFVGRHLVATLVAAGHGPIRVLSRSPERVFSDGRRSLAVAFEAVETLAGIGKLGREDVVAARNRADRGEAVLRESVEVIEGDARDWNAVREAVSSADAVVHAVGIIRETEGRSFGDTNVGTTQSLIDAMKDVGTNRLIYLGILGASDDPEMPYGRSRWKAEDAV
ncbi:MAG: NAD(P)H-binding protein, partial [Dehalococcoidia bacterium]|nr:NAD(P)H-binding protein [Dehalococcoidia bacterium]